MQGVGGEQEVLVFQMDVEVEDSLARIGVVLPPVAGQRIVFVHHFSPFEEIAEVVEAVVVEAVGIEFRAAMGQQHVVAHTGKLVAAVIEGIVAIERQGVALAQFDVPEGFK